MVTVGAEKKMKVWDLRKMKPVFEYWTPDPVFKCDISQKGLLGLGTKDSAIVILQLRANLDLERFL